MSLFRPLRSAPGRWFIRGLVAVVLGITFMAYLQPGIFLSFSELGLCAPRPGISASGAGR